MTKITIQEAISNQVDAALAAHAKAEARGQFKAAAKHLDRVGRLLARMDDVAA